MAQDIKKVNGVYMGSQELASTRFASDANLVQYTRFEGNSTATTGTNGTDYNITYSAANGKFGQGAGFNGSTSRIDLGNVLSLTGNFSINVWVNPTAVADNPTNIIQKGQSGARYPQWSLQLSTAYKMIIAACGDVSDNIPSATLTANTAITTGVWSMLTFVRDGTNIIACLNAVSDGSTAWSTAQGASTDHVEIGAVDNSGTLYQKYDGKLDELSIFNRALTSDEITSLYKTGVKKLNGLSNLNPEFSTTSIFSDTATKGYWKLENANDSSPSGYNLTNLNTATFTAGKFSNALTLTSTSSQALYIAKASATNLYVGANNFSIHTWIKTSSTGATQGIVYCGAGGAGGKRYLLRINTSNQIELEIDDDGAGGLKRTTSTTVISTGSWYQVDGVRDGNSLKLYINGNLNGTPTDITSYGNIDGGEPFTIGGEQGVGDTTPTANFFNGQIDDVAIENNKILSATEISNLYNTNIKKYMGVSNV